MSKVLSTPHREYPDLAKRSSRTYVSAAGQNENEADKTGSSGDLGSGASPLSLIGCYNGLFWVIPFYERYAIVSVNIEEEIRPQLYSLTNRICLVLNYYTGPISSDSMLTETIAYIR